MTISKMKLKYSSLFFVPFMVMLGVFALSMKEKQKNGIFEVLNSIQSIYQL